MSSKTISDKHISFEDLSDYVFTDDRPLNYVAVAATINKHIMDCPYCSDTYNALCALKEQMDIVNVYETFDEKIQTRVFSFLYSIEKSKPVQAILDECRLFEKWISINIKNLRELVEDQSTHFSHPRLATVVKSSVPGQEMEETESEIKSSLCDRNRNRVSIGLDGTLSLYFDAEEHSVGKRVIILPDDADANPQMFELTRYDDSISCVRFEGITPGQYTIVVEE